MATIIKFRAWNQIDSEYINEINAVMSLDGSHIWWDINDSGEMKYDDDPGDYKLEQFTGLQDVNGKDIYEGDIVQYSHQFYEDISTRSICRETGYIGTVVKNNGAFGILINRMNYTDAHGNYYHANDFVPFCEFDDPEADMALKGNVHANPELLEG